MVNSEHKINADSFIAWLITQTNANGTLYLERVARHYVRYLRSAPLKLYLSLPLEARNVFACLTLTDFERLREILVCASNYKEVNSLGHNSFSSGMKCYARYLTYLSQNVIKENEKNDKGFVERTVTNNNNIAERQNSKLHIVDFEQPEVCAFTDPVECIIDGKKLYGRNWRYLLVAVCEYFIKKGEQRIFTCQLRSGRLLLLKDKPANCSCQQLSNRYYVVVSYDIPTLLRFIAKVCTHCGIDLKDVVITYAPKSSVQERCSNNTKGCINGKTPQAQMQTSTDHILLPNGKCVQIDDIVDYDEAKTEIDSILRTHFAQFHGYSNKRLLWEAVRITLPLFINDNGFCDEGAVYEITKHMLCGKYVFYDLHIWEQEPNYPKTNYGLLLDFGRVNDGVFRKDEAETYFGKLKIQPRITFIVKQSSGKDLFFLYSDGIYILTEALELNDSRLGQIFTELRKLFKSENMDYIIPRDISQGWYKRLPHINGDWDWTPLLLQEIIEHYPECGIKIIKSGLPQQRIDTLAAAFVIEDAFLNTFADVAHIYLLQKRKLPEKMPAEDLRLILRSAGMLRGNELIYSLHKALGRDHRFAFIDNNQTVKILER